VLLLLLLATVQVAFDNSVDKHRVTPYSRAATEAFDMVYSGGKPDDITVLVAVIS
jgi:protein phosphatase PTC7